jgi:TetR/AcrR family transcriptional regulator
MSESVAPSPAWKDRAHQRSLASARRRADDQLGRLIKAAQDLLDSDEDMTVPAVVARAGMSTKTFYRHFESRDDLMFALLEEELTAGARVLENAIGERQDPVERLRAFIRAYLQLPGGYASTSARRAQVQEGQRLRAVNPERADEAGAPLRGSLDRIISDLVTAGLVHGVDPELTTRSILLLLNGHVVDLAYAASRDYDRLSEHVTRACFGILNLPLASSSTPISRTLPSSSSGEDDLQFGAL